MGTGLIPTPSEQFDLMLKTEALPNPVLVPIRYDLTSQLPPPHPTGQGSQQSCVAWATSYALRSYLEHVRRGWSYMSGGVLDNDRLFSPAFIYNRINDDEDNGAHLSDAFATLHDVGDLPLSRMQYFDDNYDQTPNPDDLKNIAPQFVISTAAPLPTPPSSDPSSIVGTIKGQIASTTPVVLGLWVDSTWANYRKHDDTSLDDPTLYPWDDQRTDGAGRQEHAIVIIGYDDTKLLQSGEHGAFLVINSAGQSWGSTSDGSALGVRGYAWISYKALTAQFIEAWVAQVRLATFTSVGHFETLSSAAYATIANIEPDVRNVGYDRVSSSGDTEVMQGTIDVPFTASGDIQVIVRFYEETPDHYVGQPLRARIVAVPVLAQLAADATASAAPSPFQTPAPLYSGVTTAAGYLAATSGAIPIPSPGQTPDHYSWSVQLPADAIDTTKISPGPDPRWFCGVPELYIDGIHVSNAALAIPFRLFLHGPATAVAAPVALLPPSIPSALNQPLLRCRQRSISNNSARASRNPIVQEIHLG